MEGIHAAGTEEGDADDGGGEVVFETKMKKGQQDGKEGDAKGTPFEQGVGKAAGQAEVDDIDELVRGQTREVGRVEGQLRRAQLEAAQIEQSGGETEGTDRPHQRPGHPYCVRGYFALIIHTSSLWTLPMFDGRRISLEIFIGCS